MSFDTEKVLSSPGVLGFTALFEAVATGADKIVEILLNSSNPLLKDLHGDLPVHIAARNGHRTGATILKSPEVSRDACSKKWKGQKAIGFG